jgi:hypothetical protein
VAAAFVVAAMSREIDLSGPGGNAFSIMGTAASFAKQLGWNEPIIDAMIREMKSSDYRNLCDVFEREFGQYATLINKPWEVDDDE